MSPLPRLTVHLDGPTLLRGRVLLDGHEIAGLTELDVSLGCDRVTVATMSLAISELAMDAPTLAILQANVKVTEPDAEVDEPELRTFGGEPADA